VRTRTRMTTIWCGLVATPAIALVAAQVGLSRQAQTLLAPSFTAAQAASGRAAYTENCASCHGTNLDDGAFAPALRGAEFRSSWFGRAADQLFTKLETMPPGLRDRSAPAGPPRSRRDHAFRSQPDRAGTGSRLPQRNSRTVSRRRTTRRRPRALLVDNYR